MSPLSTTTFFALCFLTPGATISTFASSTVSWLPSASCEIATTCWSTAFRFFLRVIDMFRDTLKDSNIVS